MIHVINSIDLPTILLILLSPYIASWAFLYDLASIMLSNKERNSGRICLEKPNKIDFISRPVASRVNEYLNGISICRLLTSCWRTINCQTSIIYKFLLRTTYVSLVLLVSLMVWWMVSWQPTNRSKRPFPCFVLFIRRRLGVFVIEKVTIKSMCKDTH